MRPDVSRVTGSVLGTACCLLFLASLAQGLHHMDVFHQKTVVVATGQSVDLPCVIRNPTSPKIIQIEWTKKNVKLALYSPVHGEHLFQPNVSIRAERTQTDGPGRLEGSYLHLRDVGEQDSGVYICDLSTFPLGSIRRHIRLKVKDVTTLSSPTRVTDTRTVSPGPGSPRPAVEGTLTTKTDSDVTAGEFTARTSDGNHNSSVSVSAPSSSDRGDMSAADPSTTPVSPDRSDYPTDEVVTTSRVSITHSLVTTSIPSTTVSSEPATVQLQSFPGVTSGRTTGTHRGPVFRSTQDRTADETESMDTEERSSTLTEESSSRKTTVRQPDKPSTPWTQAHDEDDGVTIETVTTCCRSESGSVTGHSLWGTIIPILIVILLAGILYHRQTIQRRMDLPPPFKPPPPPLKYTSMSPQRSVLIGAGTWPDM